MTLNGDSKGHDRLEGSCFHWTLRLFEEEYDDSASLPKQTFQILTGYFEATSTVGKMTVPPLHTAATTNKN